MQINVMTHSRRIALLACLQVQASSDFLVLVNKSAGPAIVSQELLRRAVTSRSRFLDPLYPDIRVAFIFRRSIQKVVQLDIELTLVKRIFSSPTCPPRSSW